MWDISLQADIQPRLITGEHNELRDILAKQNGWDPQNSASFQVINSEDMQRALTELCYKKTPQIRHITTGVISAYDPNDKSGTRGDGPQQHISSDEGLSYAIAFENVLTATAPAQTVTISDTLDASKLDISTLRLNREAGVGLAEYGTAGAGPPTTRPPATQSPTAPPPTRGDRA